MTTQRSIERTIVKNQCLEKYGNLDNFKEEWKKYHDSKIKARVERAEKDGRVIAIRNKPKKKQRHYDNGKLAIRQMKIVKELFAKMKNKKQEEAED